MKNPILKEFKKLKLISTPDLVVIGNKTRDKKIKVIKDKKTNLIVLEKCLKSSNAFPLLQFINHKKNVIKGKKKTIKIKSSSGNINLPMQEDDSRRVKQFKKFLKNKDILDFGCGWGFFLTKIKNAKSLNGVEIRNTCLNHLKKNYPKINVFNSISKFEKKFDLITMFHVLEHIPYQVETLKILKSKLNNNGKMIIEVPHAKDFLILQEELKEFKEFTFWSEHLVLHTYKSLKTILLKSGFKKINIQYYQRYNFSNHLSWFLKRKPPKNNAYKNIISHELNSVYCENLKRLGKTDTLIAIAE